MKDAVLKSPCLISDCNYKPLNGTVHFEWENEGGVSHLEIGETKFSWYITDKNEGTIYMDSSLDELAKAFMNCGQRS